MKMLNQLAIARIKKQLFAVCSLQKKKKNQNQNLHVLLKMIILCNMKTATHSHLFNVIKALFAYTLEIIIKE